VAASFDTIPHADLMKSLARRISDRRMLRLLKMWLKAPVAEQTAGGGWRFSGGKRGSSGTSLGGTNSDARAVNAKGQVVGNSDIHGCRVPRLR
jgi:RNA-directed DNA polymerase